MSVRWDVTEESRLVSYWISKSHEETVSTVERPGTSTTSFLFFMCQVLTGCRQSWLSTTAFCCPVIFLVVTISFCHYLAIHLHKVNCCFFLFFFPTICPLSVKYSRHTILMCLMNFSCLFLIVILKKLFFSL